MASLRRGRESRGVRRMYKRGGVQGCRREEEFFYGGVKGGGLKHTLEFEHVNTQVIIKGGPPCTLP